MIFWSVYRYKNTEYRFNEDGVCLGFFVDGKYSNDAKNGFVPQGKKMTLENQRRLVEIGKFEPKGTEFIYNFGEEEDENEKPDLQETTRKEDGEKREVERNPDGTLKKGSTANLNGRPPKRKIEDYINENDVIKIVEKAREEALKGKPDLLKELLSYMFGKPKQQIELSGGEEPIGIETRNKSDKLIKDFLNEEKFETYPENITKREQRDEEGTIFIRKK